MWSCRSHSRTISFYVSIQTTIINNRPRKLIVNIEQRTAPIFSLSYRILIRALFYCLCLVWLNNNLTMRPEECLMHFIPRAVLNECILFHCICVTECCICVWRWWGSETHNWAKLLNWPMLCVLQSQLCVTCVKLSRRICCCEISNFNT